MFATRYTATGYDGTKDSQMRTFDNLEDAMVDYNNLVRILRSHYYEGVYSAILATITDGENRIDEYILVDEE